VPTRHCIEHYNKYQGHGKASKFRSQTLLLESQIFYLNRQIKKINHENFKVCSKIKTEKHLKTKVDENHNTVAQTNATKKSDSKTSPNLTSDILRQTKQQGQRTRYYIDYKNLYEKKPYPPPPFKLTAEHFKYARESIVPSIVNLFNNIIQSGKIPKVFKTGILTPVHKKGKNPTLTTNCSEMK
jgi:hypothetical protein